MSSRCWSSFFATSEYTMQDSVRAAGSHHQTSRHFISIFSTPEHTMRSFVPLPAVMVLVSLYPPSTRVSRGFSARPAYPTFFSPIADQNRSRSLPAVQEPKKRTTRICGSRFSFTALDMLVPRTASSVQVSRTRTREGGTWAGFAIGNCKSGSVSVLAPIQRSLNEPTKYCQP